MKGLNRIMGDQTRGFVEPACHTSRVADEPLIPGLWFAGLLAFSAILVFGLARVNGLTIRTANYPFAAIAATMTLLVLLRYGLRAKQVTSMRRLKDFSEYCFLFMGFSLLGVIASYPIAAESSGFRDLILVRSDALLHFDWVGWYALVARHPVLQQLGTMAYLTIYLSPAILLGHMAWSHNQTAARQFLLAFWLAAFITLLLFPLFVAKGPLAVLWNGPIPYMPVSALYQSEMIPALRGHGLTDVDTAALRGLVCAPSFHTVCGTLYIAAAWPIARLRWPLLGLNGAMLLATPVEGNHYLTDMLMGLAVALIATAITRTLIRARGRNLLDRIALTVPTTSLGA